jgi:Uma2 family endonuclease
MVAPRHDPPILLTDEAYEKLALDERHRHWELYDGRLVDKPGVTAFHADLIDRLYRRLSRQLPEEEYGIRVDHGRLRRGSGRYFEADLCVVPRSYVEQQKVERPTQLEVYSQPIPLVIEVWSPSTGGYDVNTKIPEYQRRGDLEIWRPHPFERTLTVWRRQADGTYDESVLTDGVIEAVALPGVSIVIEELFD